jgi:hypothetical protein
MPTISTFGAASARGFGTLGSRFIYEYIDTTNQATVGTSWNGQENFSYFSFGGVSSSNSLAFTSMTFNGGTGFLSKGAVDNSGGENRTIGMGAIDVDPPSTKTTLINVTGSVTASRVYSNFRILGGNAQPTVFYSDARGAAVWPYTYSIPNCKAGDIVLLSLYYRTNSGVATSSSATNMTQIYTSTSNAQLQTFAAYVTTDGTFTTTINGNEYQQWTQAIAVLRANYTGGGGGGSLTFTTNGTFTIPTYTSLTIDATSGSGGKGGASSRETGGGTCNEGTNGGVGGLSSVVGGGINATTTTGPGGAKGACVISACRSGSLGTAATSLTTYTTGLTVGATATVTVGGGGTGGISTKTAPCTPSTPDGTPGVSGIVTITWT